MIAKPIAAFGTVVYLCDTLTGEVRDYILSEDGSYRTGYYYYVSGLARNTVIETGETIPDRTPGWLNIEHPGTSASTSGTLKIEYIKDTQWLCIPFNANPKGLPNIEKLIINSGESVPLKNGTNLLLVLGKLSINNKQFIGPSQIRVRSGDVSAISLTNADEPSYCLVFK